MNFGLHDNKGELRAKIKIYREVKNTHIFAFSLFIGQRFIENTYKFFYDSNYIMTMGAGKDGDDAFYRHYLGKQLSGCISLINNLDIIIGSEGDGFNQWKDFGVLILVDEPILNLPMLVYDGISQYLPWDKKTKTAIIPTRNKLTSEVISKNRNEVLNLKNYGTVKDYIMWTLAEYIQIDQRSRFGIYSYKLDDKFNVPIDISINNVVTHLPKELINTVGYIGSFVRYFVLQDPLFEVVLFRDAHSTLPNRNYKYDREWYDTWITTDKRFWIYHGIFYNPEHFYNLKSGFAATWGARRPTTLNSILTNEEYGHIFGYNKTDLELLYEQSTYGVDERLLYRMYKEPFFMKQSYLVGVTHLLYLWIGQENPRKYKVLKQYSDSPVNHEHGEGTILEKNMFPEGDLNGWTVIVSNDVDDKSLNTDIVNKGGIISTTQNFKDSKIIAVVVKDINNPSNSKLIADAKIAGIPEFNVLEFRDYFFKNKSWLCRLNGFILPSYSFYADLRCIFISFISVVSGLLNKPPNLVTFKEYFDTLDISLNTSMTNISEPQTWFALNLQRMIPPRWNIWQFLFHNEFLDNNAMYDYINNNNFGVNTANICSINQKLWIGDAFNYDKYFFGPPQPPPNNIVLPVNYPHST
jgi:hypothetical protein